MQHLIRRTALSLAIASTATLAVCTVTLAASSTQLVSRTFNIPSGPLDQSLTRFANQAGLRLMVASEVLNGQQSTGLYGQFSASEGIERLLGGSGLKATFSGDMLLIEKVPVAGEAVELGATMIKSQELGLMTENTGSYTAGAVSVGGKTPTAMREIPQSVSVVSSQRIEDQGLHNIGQVLNQATGITLVGGNDNDVSIYSRGFKITNVTTDGGAPNMREESYQSLPDMIQYDHIEILRGADGLNSGTGEPGGTINLVRKRALDHAQVKLATSAGSWDNYRQEVDVTGPMGFDGRLRGRFVAAYEDRGYFYDGADSQKQAFFGVLEADVTPDTLVTVGGSYEKRDMDGYWDNGLVRYSTGEDLGLSRATSLAADWSSANSQAIEGFIKVEHNLNDQWKADASYTYTKYDAHHDLGQVTTALNPVTGTGTNFSRTLREFQNEQNLLAANVHGTFEAFGREHELVIGADHENIHKYYADYSRNSPAVAVDVFSTDVNALPKPVKPTLYYEYPEWDTKKTGGYITLKARLADPLKMIIGARYNDYEDTQVSVVPDFGSTFGLGGKNSGVVTPYGGLIYDLNDNWSLYTSYAEIYKPQTNYLSFGESQLKPIEGKTYEFGVKSSFYAGRLNFSSAVYYTKRENEAVLVEYADTPTNNCCYAAGGEVISRGWDTEISGEMAEGWQMSAGYTYNINEQRQAGDSTNNGLPLSSQTPKHLFKFFTTYQLQDDLERWKVGLGANIQSRNAVNGTVRTRLSDGSLSPGTSPYSYLQAGYAVWNGLVEYRINDNWTAALNGNNLLNKHYYQTIGSSVRGNWYGEPRNYMLTLRGKF
ncbi:MAG: TonB-dependent siderophore receptor [Candidatus Pseudomonas phytovorans]|uniref:TonB-dependent siderophore receptor n=1 Tax=Candidatus Pseudomonas phytovorans TaxID=3121377 RepID=A0AAJ5WIY0_9PSED|nr:TonB-dependent siderophore receptor [Pseudomonas sp.]WEK30512.1 MAG: TonB-dependent siderophore receptor [Pseudomonas sp.]